MSLISASLVKRAHRTLQSGRFFVHEELQACAEALLDLSELDEKWLVRRLDRESAK